MSKVSYSMNMNLLLLPILVIGVSMAYAEPLERVETLVLNHGLDATVQIFWDLDESAKKYELGCVSCIPNTKFITTDDEFVMKNITPFPNSSRALLYIIAFDSDDEITNAKQIVIDLEERSLIAHNVD